MRGQLRMIVFGVVAALIVVAVIVESPGTVEALGLAVVFAAMIALIVRARSETPRAASRFGSWHGG